MKTEKSPHNRGRRGKNPKRKRMVVSSALSTALAAPLFDDGRKLRRSNARCCTSKAGPLGTWRRVRLGHGCATPSSSPRAAAALRLLVVLLAAPLPQRRPCSLPRPCRGRNPKSHKPNEGGGRVWREGQGDLAGYATREGKGEGARRKQRENLKQGEGEV